MSSEGGKRQQAAAGDPKANIIINKPKLNNIFAEVEKNLPSIDFELSDVSSDEEVAIFQRNVRTPEFDDDKDIDESLSTDDWEHLFSTDNTDLQNINDEPQWRKVPLSEIRRQNDSKQTTKLKETSSVGKGEPRFSNVDAMLHAGPSVFDRPPSRTENAPRFSNVDAMLQAGPSVFDRPPSRTENAPRFSNVDAMLQAGPSVFDRPPSRSENASKFSNVDAMLQAGPSVFDRPPPRTENASRFSNVDAMLQAGPSVFDATQLRVGNNQNGKRSMFPNVEAMLQSGPTPFDMPQRSNENASHRPSGRNQIQTTSTTTRNNTQASVAQAAELNFSSGFLNMMETEIRKGPSAGGLGGMSLDFGDMDLEDIVESMNQPFECTGVIEPDKPIVFSDSFIQKVEDAILNRADNNIQDITNEVDTESLDRVECEGWGSHMQQVDVSIQTRTDSHTDSPLVGVRSAWVDSESDTCNDSSRSTTPRSEKRKEMGELSPTLPAAPYTKSAPIPPEKVISKYFSSAPTLGLQNINTSHLELLIDNNEAQTETGATLESTVPVVQFNTQQGQTADDAGERMSLIERLAKLSMTESGSDLKNIDPNTGAFYSKQPEPKELKTARNISMGEQRTEVRPRTSKATEVVNIPKIPVPRPNLAQRKRGTEPETVFLDLRDFNHHNDEQKKSIQAVHRILKYAKPMEETEDGSSSDDEDTGVMWHEQRRRMKAAISRGDLPQPEKTPNTITNKPVGVGGQTHMTAQRLARPAAKSVSAAPLTLAEEPSKTTKPSAEDTQEQEKQRRLQLAKKLREQRESERQSRVRLGQRLDALRPLTSAKGKQHAAEATPTIFDIEASYEPAPQSLPGGMSAEVECTLLTVHLSSPGEIVTHRSSTNKSVDTGHGLSASYTTLVTWLLSLVPNRFDFLQPSEGDSTNQSSPLDALTLPPFHVVALQQVFQDGQLCLQVAVCPRHASTANVTPSKTKMAKKRDEMKNISQFQHVLTKYLSHHSLHSVCPWLQDLVSLDVSSQEGDFIYRPPLPNITTRPLSTFLQMNPDPTAVRKVFSIPVGFFWETCDSDEAVCDQDVNEDGLNYDTQNTMSLVYKKVYRDQRAMMGILNRVLQEGLDLAGIRLLYPTGDLMKVAAGTSTTAQDTGTSQQDMLNNIGPIVALAIRGTFARTIWLDAVGPSDPCLARKTDPNSLCALYGGESRGECLLFCPRNPTRVLCELSRWFGGRVPPSGVIDVGTRAKTERPSSAGRGERPSSGGRRSRRAPYGDATSEEACIPTHKPPAPLVSTTRSSLLLVISPLVPTRCMGLMLATCQRRGYQLRGVRRTRLTPKRATVLGVPTSHIEAFTADMSDTSTTFDPSSTATLIRPSTILLLIKENCLHNCASLIEALMVQMSLLNVLGSIQKEISEPLTSPMLFQASPYSESLLHSLGGDFSRVPEGEYGAPPGYIEPQLYTNPEVEQIVTLTLTSHQLMKTFGLFLGRLLRLVPYSRTSTGPVLTEGLELVGIKWLPGLAIHHAKELTPYEVGDKQWKPSIHTLTSEPAVVLILRGINAFQRIDSIVNIKSSRPGLGAQSISLDKIMSPTPHLAYRLARLFFFERELFSDPQARSLLPYLPSIRHLQALHADHSNKSKKTPETGAREVVEEGIFSAMLSGPQVITSVLLAKPTVVTRHLGKFLKRLTRENFLIVGLRLEVLGPDYINTVMPPGAHKNVSLLALHERYLTSGASLVLCVQRENAVRHLVELLGPDDPRDARRSSQFLWRAEFGTDPVANGLYGSANYIKSVEDQHMFFPHGLCCKQTEQLTAEQVCCPGEDDIVDLSQQRSVTLAQASNVSPLTQNKARSNASGTCTSERLPVTILTQTNCILLPPSLLIPESRGHKIPYIDIVDYLISHGFELVGARMLWLTERQAEHYLHLVEAGSYKMVPALTSGPSLVLALQRDNAVMAFDSLLGTSFDKESIYSKYSDKIIKPKDTKQACDLLAFFFDKLMPGAQAQIVAKGDV